MAPLPASLEPTGRLRAAIRCVLFDVYGTLFISGSGDIGAPDSGPDRISEINELLKSYGLPQDARALLDGFHRAIEIRHSELRSKGIDFPEVRIDRIWQEVLQIDDQETAKRFAVEFEWISNPTYPMPHLADLLAACRKKEPLMGIISNAQFYTPFLFRWFLDEDPPALGFDSDLIFYSYCYETAKPAASLFEMAAGRLANRGIRPNTVLYLGNDMLNDIYPASNAGFQTALFAGDQRSLRLRTEDPRCLGLKPDLVVTDLGQLIRLI